MPQAQAIGSLPATTIPVPAGTECSSDIQSQPQLTSEYLWGLTLPKLRNICRERKISATGNKGTLIERMLRILSPGPLTQDAFSRSLREIETGEHQSDPVPHEIYRANFNALELHDRRFYSLGWPFTVKEWRTKMLLCLLDVQFINVWVLYSELKLQQLLSFRKDLGLYLFRAIETKLEI
jgi:hypothetical protein